MLEGIGVPGRGGQRRKKWDNCNSIINKIYLKIDETAKAKFLLQEETYQFQEMKRVLEKGGLRRGGQEEEAGSTV